MGSYGRVIPSPGLLVATTAGCLVGIVTIVAGETYEVSYNPYGNVNWATVLRCQSQHHDHVFQVSSVHRYDAAGYNAVTFMTYSGNYVPSTQAQWDAMGNAVPDPGQPSGWVGFRRWPPESNGAPDPSTLVNISFYIPGAEEPGLLPDGSHTLHMHSTFLATYIEGVGCTSCGIGGIGVALNNSSLPASQRYSSNQELIDLINLHGGHATLNHPIGPQSNYTALSGVGSIEIFNNYMALSDETSSGGVTNRIAQMLALWDVLLEANPQTWGVSVNDWFGAAADPWEVTNPTESSRFGQFLTFQNLDRGKLQVLVTAYDLASYRLAFEAGAFFSIVEDNAVKNAYPTVSDISVTGSLITISTIAGTETVTWIGNGATIASGPVLDLRVLPPNLTYVRAELDDENGRVLYVQPFSLVVPGVPCSGADLNRDGNTDAADVLLFVSSLLGQSQQSSGCGDMNGDGLINGEDIAIFVNCFVTGAC